MKKILTLTFFCCFIAALTISPNNSKAEETTPLQKKIIEETETREAINNGINWLINAQESNGHFRYEYIPFLDRYTNDDNIVRQTGTLYVLGEIIKKDKTNKYDIKKNIQKGISYIDTNSIDGEYNGYSFRCVLKNTNYCSLGATSLALIAILDLTEKYPALGSEYKYLEESYMKHILAMKTENKGFIDAYNTNEETEEKESSFSNGEAYLALIRYNNAHPTEETEEILNNAFEYFQSEYGKNWDNNFYLWGMAAIKSLPTIEQKHINFAKDYTDFRLSVFENKKRTTRNTCAYIEGVASAYSILENNITEEEKLLYSNEIIFWLKKNKTLQIKKSDILKTIFNTNFPQRLGIKKTNRAVGGFLTDLKEPVQRIDFTQHCISAYLQKLIDIDQKSL